MLVVRRVALRSSFALVLAVAAALLFAASPSPAATRIDRLPPKVKPGLARSRTGGGISASGISERLVARGATNMGFCGGDDWEPEIAADRFRHVYVVWAHYPGDPSCDASEKPRHIYIRVSSDGGRTFGPKHIVPTPPGHPYPKVVDCVVTVNERGVVYVSFLGYGLKSILTDVVVAKSTDFGATFTSRKVNGPLCKNCDHPWTVAHGDNVYVAYAHGKNHYLSRSSDGARTWKESLILRAQSVAFPEGGVVDRRGNAWFAWGDCRGACASPVAAVYRVSRTKAGTSRTKFARVATGPAGPPCPFPTSSCGFAYFGPQDDIAIDAAGTLYLVWQDGQNHFKPKSPPIVRLSRCERRCTRSSNWHRVSRVDDKTRFGCPRAACYALFPRVEGGEAGRISTIWMDDRLGDPLNHNNGWNVWYRTSTNGGESWTGPGRRVSQYDPSRPESDPNGFKFPYGDYMGLDLTPDGRAVMVWGEGVNYIGGPENPGHVIYRSIRT